MNIEIIEPGVKERKFWLALRSGLWPEMKEEWLIREQREILMNNDQVAFLAKSSSMVLGFIEASLKPFPDLCKHQPNAYLQAWFVVESFRAKGIGGALLKAIERWSLNKGCQELVSSTTNDYPKSPLVHLSNGFKVVPKPELFFIKDLGPESTA